MSRIVKSIAVVDDRRREPDDVKAYLESRIAASVISRTVLKGGMLDGAVIRADIPATKDEYLDELNRARLKLDEAKSELRAIRGEIENAKEEYDSFMESREDKDLLSDEIYTARKKEIDGLEAKAKKQCDKLLTDAKKQSDKIAQKARAEGYEDGYSTGYQTAQQSFEEQAAPRLAELTELITALASYGEILMKEKEDEFVELALAIAGKVMAREIKSDPKYIIDMLRDVLIKNHRETYINLSVSPDMTPARAKANEAIIEQLREIAPGLSIYIEKEVGEGYMVMETSKGVTDMSLDTQLANIKDSLLTADL